MKNNLLYKILLSISCSSAFDVLPFDPTKKPGSTMQDPAFLPLHNDHIISFRNSWKEYLQEKHHNNVIRGMSDYVATILSYPNANYGYTYTQVYKELSDDYYNIVLRFRDRTQSDLFMHLINRKSIQEVIRSDLIIKNKNKKLYEVLNSDRISCVFDKFNTYFRINSVTKYQFDGTFQDFVISTYKNYFYPKHCKDIWEMLSRVDIAKLEVEKNVKGTVEIARTFEDIDIPIKPILTNIVKVNRKIFDHSGHAPNTNGISYDAYYLILNYLCECYTKKVNEVLADYNLTVRFVDLNAKGGGNKGIVAKISNAKDLFPELFNIIRESRGDLPNIHSLKEKIYLKGCSDNQGANAIWKRRGLNNTGSVAVELDTELGRENSQTADLVIKATGGIYTLMREFIARNRDLVEEYNKGIPYIKDINKLVDNFSSWFTDAEYARHSSSLSDFDYIDQIRAAKALIREIVQSDEYKKEFHGELLDFNGMQDEYSGSSQNTNVNINENRRFNEVNGFDMNAKMKERGRMTTHYEKLQSLYGFFTAIPLDLQELFYARSHSRKVEIQYPRYPMCSGLVPENSIRTIGFYESSDFDAMHYLRVPGSQYIECGSMMYNILSGDNQLVQPYLAIAHTMFETLDNLIVKPWAVSASTHKSLCVYDRAWQTVMAYIDIPLAGDLAISYFNEATEDRSNRETTELCYQFIQHGMQETETIQSYRMSPNHYIYVGLATLYEDPHYILLHQAKTLKQLDTLTSNDIKQYLAVNGFDMIKRYAENSIGLPFYIGLEDLGNPDIKKSLNSIKVADEFKGQANRYLARLSELAVLEEAFTSLLKLMLTTSWYLTIPGLPQVPGLIDGDTRKHAFNLFKSLHRGIFNIDDLNWFFEYAAKVIASSKRQFDGQAATEYKFFTFLDNLNIPHPRKLVNTLWADLLVVPNMNTMQDNPLLDITGLYDLTATGVNFEEDGLLAQFMESAQFARSSAERFILLHAFLYEKAYFTKRLRDTLILLFKAVDPENDTLMLEIDQIYRIREAFNIDAQDLGKYVSVLRDTTSSARRSTQSSTRSNMSKWLTQDIEDFNVTISSTQGLVNESIKKLGALFSITDGELPVMEKLSEISKALLYNVKRTATFERIESTYIPNKDGYFITTNGYFKIISEKDTYYLHQSGNLVCVHKTGKIEPIAFNLDNAQDKAQYDSLLRQGIEQDQARPA